MFFLVLKDEVDNVVRGMWFFWMLLSVLYLNVKGYMLLERLG